ncbi:MAG: hypothetical protein EOP84_00575 [Verrucomicrobiaceae bacterium]|nr:MAG: hypothetical protein EOP84_00575 [Verrucomicrobiaceae bacterium]
MTVSRLIAKLQAIADAAPDTIVLIGRGEDSWFDEVEDVDYCTIKRKSGEVSCGPHQIDETGKQEVVVMR